MQILKSISIGRGLKLTKVIALAGGCDECTRPGGQEPAHQQPAGEPGKVHAAFSPTFVDAFVPRDPACAKHKPPALRLTTHDSPHTTHHTLLTTHYSPLTNLSPHRMTQLDLPINMICQFANDAAVLF